MAKGKVKKVEQPDAGGGLPSGSPAPQAGTPVAPPAPLDQPGSAVPTATPPATTATAPAAVIPQAYDLAAGLFDFYSSQVEAMLAQYRNINQLLGPTSDWTAPGTLCEVFIRDVIRRVLPSRYSVDKGFIFGRRVKGKKEVHSPEIDVLVHDTHEYAPVYRLEDFVIVRPAAVRAVIQVKRTLDGDKLKKAIDNLVDAKQHLEAFGVVRIPNKDDGIFSAAIFFGDDLKRATGGISKNYNTTLGKLKRVVPLARPDFLGSLANRFYVLPFGSKDQYEGYPSQVAEGNVALVTFIAYLTQCILPPYASLTLYRPRGVSSDQTIQLNTSPKRRQARRHPPSASSRSAQSSYIPK